MRMYFILLLSMFLLNAFPNFSSAEVVKFRFTGTLDNIDESLSQEFSIGESVVGTYSVDDNTLAASNLQVTIGGDYTLSATTGSVQVRTGIWFTVTFSGDSSGINGPQVNGSPPKYFDIQLDDSNEILQDGVLPKTYQISQFGWDRSNINFPDDRNRLDFEVQSIEVEVNERLYTQTEVNEIIGNILNWGDTNGDGRIGLEEVINALRIMSTAN